MRLLILLTFILSNNPKEIARVNNFKNAAEESFKKRDFDSAINNYRFLIDSLEVDEDEIFLNLAHAYYEKYDTANARTYYSQASMSPNNQLKSIAYQQLGVMAKHPQTLKQSLQYLKASLKADPKNDGARYDYELVKKLIQEQEQNQENQDQQDQENQENEDQENQDQENQENQEDEQNEDQEQQEQENQENQENQEQEGEQDEQEPQEGEENPEQQEEQDPQQSAKEKLEEMNIPEDKARMILEAMKNAEIQYLQQQKRKATERPPSGKPDW